MDLLQLRYFQVVARQENVTRAAEELRVAQPSLSRTIARLEESLGVPLFERRGRRIRLNQFGELFLKRVERCFLELEEGQREIADLSGAECGSITISAATPRLLSNLVSEYLTGRPKIKFRLLQVMQQQEIENQLITGDTDLCISALPIEQAEIHCEPLITEEIFLAVPPGHPLGGRKRVNLNEIAAEPLICYTTECGLREVINNFCRQADFTPNIAFECPTAEVICSLVRAGLGVALIPSYLWEVINPESLVKIRVAAPLCRRTIWLSWVKERYLSMAARDFRQFVIAYFSRAGRIEQST